MPNGRQNSQRTQTIQISGQRVALDLSLAVLGDETSFRATSVSMPAQARREILKDGSFNFLKDLLLKGRNETITGEKDISQGPVPGKEYQYTVPNGVGRLQLYYCGGWLLSATVEGRTKENVNSPQAEAFFQSFNLTDVAKKAYQGPEAVTHRRFTARVPNWPTKR